MSDPDFSDRVIADAVADYRTTTMAAMKPAGAGASIVTARHRRNRRVAGAAAFVAVTMVGTGAGYAALRDDDRNGAPVGGVPTSVPATSMKPAEPTTTAPSTASSPTGGTTPGKAHDLRNARLDLPEWADATECPSGPTKFTGGRAGAITTLGEVAAADVDGDGSGDDIALIRCRPGEGFIGQVVAFHKNADGTFRRIGLVVQPPGGEPDPPKDDEIHSVTDLRVRGSQVDVRVGSYETTFTDGAARLGTSQWRTYGWNGSRFAQTGGPRSFEMSPSAAHLETTVSALAFGPPSGGKQHGVMTVKVRNTGSAAVHPTLLVRLVEVQAVTAKGCSSTDDISECDLGRMAPRSSRTFTFEGDIDAGARLELKYSIVRLRLGDRVITTDGLRATYAK
ncbi:hypothetical protein AB0M20_22050 [Actinoplanes sp. NPDC051633]|uniref:hypothetical protein n=1 Tax=Actinoplanes sp. NPDC051633 TaxID=3155670 RepID=UPI0034489B5E